MGEGAARARANIALVKYWGKADAALNTPAVGSISITLEALWSETRVALSSELTADVFELNGTTDEAQTRRVSACLDLLRDLAGLDTRARIESRNNFPTGAGLASSASGFAALVTAADAALGLGLGDRELSILARRGSGSAARSIYGGFVEMHAGTAPDGRDSFAEPLADASHWPLDVVVAITNAGPKAVGSGPGMERSAASSPYYPAWVETSPHDLAVAREALAHRDFEQLAAVAEHSCLKMHAAAMASEPPLLYWNGATLECVETVRRLRREGVPVFFTIDAGPQLKAVCLPEARARVVETLGALPGVVDTLVSGLGPGVERL